MEPRRFCEVIGKKRWDTDKSTLIASDNYWDGNNFERGGRNSFLWKTKNGRYFVTHQTCWQGERDRLVVLSREEAIEMYEELDHDVAFEEAFDETPEEA